MTQPLFSSSRIVELKHALKDHPVYAQIDSPQALRLFMEHHIFCVWDFMSLVKSLQLHLTGMILPWRPPKNLELARLINEIILDEETDRINNQTLSHFQLYLNAMDEAKCDLGPITTVIAALDKGHPLADALAEAALPAEVQNFILTTFRVLEAPPEVQAAVFFHAREDIIPKMFMEMVSELHRHGLNCASFLIYLERHIQLDGEEHGPRAHRILDELLTQTPALIPVAEAAIEEALNARKTLWDFVAQQASTPLLQPI